MITLPWMNRIREGERQGQDSKFILSIIKEYGTAEEMRITEEMERRVRNK